MKHRTAILGLVVLAVLLPGGILYYWPDRAVSIGKYEILDRPAKIHPDYSSTMIPPNIAPLNFTVQEQGTYYCAKIYSQQGSPIEIFSRSPNIIIQENAWHKLLCDNKGRQVNFDIFVRTNKDGWVRFATINSKIAFQDVDSFVVYRRMHPTHIKRRGPIGIYQRDLSSFDEKVVLDNQGCTSLCVNCHSFSANRPDRVLMGVRTVTHDQKILPYMTLLAEGDNVTKINAKFGYTAWHPSGRIAVYSIDHLPMFLHTSRQEIRDTFDIEADLAYFVTGSNTIRTSPQISSKDRVETWPAWSGDGRFLYFCTTQITWADQNKFPPDGYDNVKYDLVRIGYDVENDKWGRVETVLSSKDTGLSIAMPRISPDGRWLVFCMCNYGYFPPWQKDSDLYIMDLNSVSESGRYEYRRLDISTDDAEGWHSWSSNSRWLVFSSKSQQGPFTRCYLSYVDENGKAYKPLVLPQERPDYYDDCVEIFNTPEFVTGPIKTAGTQMKKCMNGDEEVSITIPVTGATPKPGQPWHE